MCQQQQGPGRDSLATDRNSLDLFLPLSTLSYALFEASWSGASYLSQVEGMLSLVSVPRPPSDTESCSAVETKVGLKLWGRIMQLGAAQQGGEKKTEGFTITCLPLNKVTTISALNLTCITLDTCCTVFVNPEQRCLYQIGQKKALAHVKCLSLLVSTRLFLASEPCQPNQWYPVCSSPV